MVRETRYLLVGNLPESTTENEITEYFKRFGKIQKVKLERKADDTDSDEKEEGCITSLTATVAFTDIKSASNAHKAEKKIGNNVLSSEYSSGFGATGSIVKRTHEPEIFPRAPPPPFNPNRKGFDEEADGFDVYYGLSPQYGDGPGPNYPNAQFAERGRPRERWQPGGPPGAPFPGRGAKWVGGAQRQFSDSGSKDGFEKPKATTSVPASSPTASQSSSLKRQNKKEKTSKSGERSQSRSSSNSSRSSSASSGSASASSSKERTKAPAVMPQQPESQDCEMKDSEIEPGEREPLGILIRKLPLRSSDTSLRDGLFHEYKKYGKITAVQISGVSETRYAIISFKQVEDATKALDASQGRRFFGAPIVVTQHEGIAETEDCEFLTPEAQLDEHSPKATRTLFLGNLEKEITIEELKEKLEKYGEILDVDVKRQGAVTAYAFIQFTDISAVVRSLKDLDGISWGATKLKVGFGKSMATPVVWLGNLADTVHEGFLCRQFSRFGALSHTVVDKENHRGLVFFLNPESAQYALPEMRNRIWNGKKIHIDYASRDCQEAFFKKMEASGQLRPGERPDPRWMQKQMANEPHWEEGNDPNFKRGGFNQFGRGRGRFQRGRGNFRGRGAGSFESGGAGGTYPTEEFPQRNRKQFDEFSQGSAPYMEDDSYERQLQEYGHSQRERHERSSQSPPNYDDNMYYERAGSQTGQDYDLYDQHRFSTYRSLSPPSDREIEVNNDEYTQYTKRTPSDERYYYKEKYYEEGRSRDRSHSSDSEQRYRLTSEVVRRRASRSRSPVAKLKRTKELPISYRSHTPPTPTDDEPYFHSDNSPTDFDSAYRKYDNYRKRPNSVENDKKTDVLLNTGLRKEIEAKSEERSSRKRSYDQLSPKRSDSLQRLERQQSRGSRADSMYEYDREKSAKDLITKVARLRSELNERTGMKDSPSSGSSSDIDPSMLTEAELTKLHREKNKLLQKLTSIDDTGNNSDIEMDIRHVSSSKKARLEHKYLQKSDSLTKQEIKEKLKLLDESQLYRKQVDAMRKKELLREYKKSKSASELKKDLFDYSEEDAYNSPGFMPKKRRKVDSESDKRSRAYRSRCDDERGAYSSDEDKDRADLLIRQSGNVQQSRTLSSLDARLESDVFHSKEQGSSGSDNNKELGEHSGRSHRRKSKKDTHITPLIPLGDDDMPDPETCDPRTPRNKCDRPTALPLPDFAQFIQFSPLPSPCHSPERYSDLPSERERRHATGQAASGSSEQSPCFSPQSSSSKTHSPSQSPSGSGSDSKGNTNSESGSGDVIPPGFPTETEQIDPDENKVDSLDSIPDPTKIPAASDKSKNDENDSYSDNNSDLDLNSDNLSIEERIRQLDEKWNKAQAVASITPKVIPDVDSVVGNNTAIPATLPSYTPPPIVPQATGSPAVSSIYSKYKIRKRNDASGPTSEKSEQSEIVQTVLSKSSIFDQDSKRLGQTNDTVETVKDTSTVVNDNSPKNYSAWNNKNDMMENPMVTVPGSLLDRLGQGSNGSFPTLTVNTTFPSVTTNNVSLNKPVVSCSSGVYDYESRTEKVAPLLSVDVAEKNGPSLPNTNNKAGDDDAAAVEDVNNSEQTTIKSENDISETVKQADSETSVEKNVDNVLTVKIESKEDVIADVTKADPDNVVKAADIEKVTKVTTENGDDTDSRSVQDNFFVQVKDEHVGINNSTIPDKSKSNSLHDSDMVVECKSEVLEANTVESVKSEVKLEHTQDADTSPAVVSESKPVLNNVPSTVETVKVEETTDNKNNVKLEHSSSKHPEHVQTNNTNSIDSASAKDNSDTKKVEVKVESQNEVKIKSILKKPSESDIVEKVDVKPDPDQRKESSTSKSTEKSSHSSEKSSSSKDKHLHKQSSTKSEKDDTAKEPSQKKAKVSKDKEKRSDSSHRDDKHKKKESDKKSESSSHKGSSSSEKKEDKSSKSDKHKSKSGGDKDKKDGEKKSSSSKDESKKDKDSKDESKESKKESKDEKKKKSDKKDKERKEEKAASSSSKEEKAGTEKDKSKDKKEEKAEKEKTSEKRDKSSDRKDKHKEKDSHKHSKHSLKSPDKKSKSAHKDTDGKEKDKEAGKESKEKEKSSSKEHTPKENASKESEKEKVETKEKEKSEKKASATKKEKEHKSSSSHKVKKSKDESSSSNKSSKEENDSRKVDGENAPEEKTPTKKSKEDEKKVKDDHNEHKKKDETSNRNNKDSPDKSKDVNRKEGSEKSKNKEKASGDKCKEEKSRGNKEKENKDKDPDHTKSKSRSSSTTECADKPKLYTNEVKTDKAEDTEKDDGKKSESKKEEKKNKDSEMSKNSSSSCKHSNKDSDKKSGGLKLEKMVRSKSSESKSRNKTPESISKSSRRDGHRRRPPKDMDSPPPCGMDDGLTEEDRLIFAQFAEEPYMSMYDKVKRRSTEKKMHCQRDKIEQKKLLHAYKRGHKGKNGLSDISESSESSTNDEHTEHNHGSSHSNSSPQKRRKKFFSSDDSDSSTDTNVLQTTNNKNKAQLKKPKRILDIYSSDSEEEELSAKTPMKKSVTTKKKKAEVQRDSDTKFDFDSISDSDNKTSATQQAKAKTVGKANKKSPKVKPDTKPAPKNMKKDIKPKPKLPRKDLIFKDLFSDDSDESMLSDSDSDSDIMMSSKSKKQPFLTNHKNDKNKKKLPRGSSIYTSSEESETDDEFKPMSPPKSTVLPKKMPEKKQKPSPFSKQMMRKDRESDSFSSDHDDRSFDSKKNVTLSHKSFSDSFDSDGHSDPQITNKHKKKNKLIDHVPELEKSLKKQNYRDKDIKDIKEIHKMKNNKKINDVIIRGDDPMFQNLTKLEIAKVYSETMYEKETLLSNLTNKDNVPPILTDINKEPLFKLDVDHVRNDIPTLKDITLDTSGKIKNKKHKKENKKKKKNKEKGGRDSSKDRHDSTTSNKKLGDLKTEVVPKSEKSDNFIPDSDSENTVNRNLFDVMKSPGPENGKKPLKNKDMKHLEIAEHKSSHKHEKEHSKVSDGEMFSDSERRKPTGKEAEVSSHSEPKKLTAKEKRKLLSGKAGAKKLSADVFDFQDDDSGIKPIKESHMKITKPDMYDVKGHQEHEKDDSSNVQIEVEGVEIEYTTDEHDYKDEGNVCPIVETTEVVIEEAPEVKVEKEKPKAKKRKGRKNSGKDGDGADVTTEALSAVSVLVKDDQPVVEDVCTEIVQFDTPVSNEQELVIDEGVSLHVEDETENAVKSIQNDTDETAKAVESILLDGMPTYSISEPVEPTPQLDQNYLQPEFAPGLPTSVPQVGTEVEANTTSTPVKGKKGRKPKRTKSGQGDALLNENAAGKVADGGKPFDLLVDTSFTSVISNPLDTNDDDDDGRLQIDFDPPKPEAKQKKPRKPKQTKAGKMNDAAVLAAENKLDNLFGNFHRGQDNNGELNRDSLSSENSELERSKNEDLLFMDREDQRHDSDMLSPDERSTSDDLTSPTDATKTKSRRGRKPKNKDPATAPIPRTNSPRSSRTLSPRSPRNNFDPRSPKSDGFDAKLNGPKALVIDEGIDVSTKGAKLSSNVFDFDDNDETGAQAPITTATPKQRKPYRRKKGEPNMQSPNRAMFSSPEHKPEDKLIIGSPETNGMFSPEHGKDSFVDKKGLFSPSFQPEEQKLDVKHVADDKPPEPLFKAFFEAKSNTEKDIQKLNPLLVRKNSKDGNDGLTAAQIISNVDKTIDDVSKGLFESTDDEAGNVPGDQARTPKQKRQSRKAKDEDIKSPVAGVMSPIKSPIPQAVPKSPMGLVKSPVVNPLPSPQMPLSSPPMPGSHHAVHQQPLMLPGMGIGQPVNSLAQIGEPQLAGHVPMMSPPLPVASSATMPKASAHSMHAHVPDANKGMESPLRNLQSPGKATIPSPLKTTVLQSSPVKSTGIVTMAQTMAATTTVSPSTQASTVQQQQQDSSSKLESPMEGALKGAMSGFLVPGLSANSAMNVVQGLGTVSAPSSGPSAVPQQQMMMPASMTDIQKRQEQLAKLTQDQQAKLTQEQQMQFELQQKQQVELQRQQEHHIKLKEQELKQKEFDQKKETEWKEIEQRKEMEQRKELEQRKEIEQKKEMEQRKQMEQNKKLQEELKTKEEEKKQLEILHEQLQRQQAMTGGVTVGPGAQVGQPALLSPGAMQRARPSLPSPNDKQQQQRQQLPRPQLAAHHQMPVGAPFGMPGQQQQPGGAPLRPGQIPSHWTPAAQLQAMQQLVPPPLGQEKTPTSADIIMRHQQLQQHIMQKAQAQKGQAQSMAELQAQLAKQQAQQAQSQAKQTAQQVAGKASPAAKAGMNGPGNKKAAEMQQRLEMAGGMAGMQGKDAPIPGSQEAANQLTQQIKQQLALQAQQQQAQQQPGPPGHPGQPHPGQPGLPQHPLQWQMQHMRPDNPRQPGPGAPAMVPMSVESRTSMPGPVPVLGGNPQQVQRVSPHPPTKSPTVAQTAPNMLHGFSQHQTAAPRAPSPAVAKTAERQGSGGVKWNATNGPAPRPGQPDVRPRVSTSEATPTSRPEQWAGVNGPVVQPPPGLSPAPRPAHQQPPSAHQQQPDLALQLTHQAAPATTPATAPTERNNPKDKFIQQQKQIELQRQEMIKQELARQQQLREQALHAQAQKEVAIHKERERAESLEREKREAHAGTADPRQSPAIRGMPGYTFVEPRPPSPNGKHPQSSAVDPRDPRFPQQFTGHHPTDLRLGSSQASAFSPAAGPGTDAAHMYTPAELQRLQQNGLLPYPHSLMMREPHLIPGHAPPYMLPNGVQLAYMAQQMEHQQHIVDGRPPSRGQSRPPSNQAVHTVSPNQPQQPPPDNRNQNRPPPPPNQTMGPPSGRDPHPGDGSILSILQRYPMMWQGMLGLKNDQCAVQMHFISGFQPLVKLSLPQPAENGISQPLRIAQRMRLEQTQLEGVEKRMQLEKDYCMMLALPCGRDHTDIYQQTRAMSTGFIQYLQQKQAAGIVNVADPGSQQPAYVVHIFPPCDFSQTTLSRLGYELLYQVKDLAHLIVIIATVA